MGERGDQQLGMAEGQQERLQRRLVLIYRDNDLFRQYAREIAGALSATGYKVEEQKFDQGASEESIGNWAAENQETIKGADLLTDATFVRSLPKELRDQVQQSMLGDGGLDTVMDVATTRAVLGDTWRGEGGIENQTYRTLETTKNLERSKQIFLAIVKNILANSENVPDSVVVLTPNMEEHDPFRQVRDDFRAAGGRAEIAKQYSGRVHEELQRLFPDLPTDLVLTDYDARQMERLLTGSGVDSRTAEKQVKEKRESDNLTVERLLAQNAEAKESYEGIKKTASEEMRQAYPHVKSAGIVAQWLRDAGIPEDRIQVLDELDGAIDETSDRRWILYDRHNFFKGKKPTDKALSMPLSNLFERSRKSGLLTLEPQALNKALAEVIEEQFKGQH